MKPFQVRDFNSVHYKLLLAHSPTLSMCSINTLWVKGKKLLIPMSSPPQDLLSQILEAGPPSCTVSHLCNPTAVVLRNPAELTELTFHPQAAAVWHLVTISPCLL